MRKKKKFVVSQAVLNALNERVEKYKKKLQSLQISTRKDGDVELQLKNYTAAHLRLLLIEEAVRKLGLTTMLKPFYMSFARQVHKVRRIHSGSSRDIEIKVKMGSWKLRGLDEKILKEIVKKIEELEKGASGV